MSVIARADSTSSAIRSKGKAFGGGRISRGQSCVKTLPRHAKPCGRNGPAGIIAESVLLRTVFFEGSRSVKYAAIGPIAVHLPDRVETNEELRAQFPSGTWT